MVLIITLWLITIMAVFGLGLARVSYSNYRFAKFKADRFLSLYAMNAIVAMCKLDRLEDETPGYDTFLELANEKEEIFGKAKVIYFLVDEERLININRASSSILKKIPGMDMDKAVAITSSKFRPFRAKQGLLLVDEIDEEDYLNIKDVITIYGEGRVNINTCSEDVLGALGMKDYLVGIIMRFRKGQDGELYTSDDRPFKSKGGVIESIKEEYSLSLRDEQDLVAFMSKNILDTRSNNYRIIADIYVSDKLVARYSIVFGRDRSSAKFHIREWNQS